MNKVTAILKLTWLIAMMVFAVPLILVGAICVVTGSFLLGGKITRKVRT